MATATPLFTQHSRRWRENRYVYPVISRRSRGLSIGVNLSPDKACTFRCVYCSVDRSVPGTPGPVELPVLARELDSLLAEAASGELFSTPPFSEAPAALRRLNDVAFSGDGEPTSVPEFPAALRLAAEALERRSLDAKIVVITNATLLDLPEVKAALASLDARRAEIWAKLDAGTPEHYLRIDRSRVPLERVLANLLETGRIRPLIIQSMFVKIDGRPPPESEIAAWLGRLEKLRDAGCRLAGVQVYTSARKTAEASVSPLEPQALESIAARVRALGLNAEVFA